MDSLSILVIILFASHREKKMSTTSTSRVTDVDVRSLNATSSNSSHLNDDISIEPTKGPKVETLHDGDSCTWYSGAICSRPRSCFDCLNVVIPGQDCAISPHGECMNSFMVSNVGGYPMANYTYCSSSDTVCSSCRASWTSDHMAKVQVSPSAMCVGKSGCICLSPCELPDHDDIIVDNWCKPVLDDTLFRLVAGFIIGTIALFVIAAVLTKCQLARRLRQDLENSVAQNTVRAAGLRERRRPVASAHLPQLSLSGWESMREKLVSSEHSRLGGISGSTRPALAKSSATPLAAVVEQGDGYRPLSPSEYVTRRDI